MSGTIHTGGVYWWLTSRGMAHRVTLEAENGRGFQARMVASDGAVLRVQVHPNDLYSLDALTTEMAEAHNTKLRAEATAWRKGAENG